MAEFKKPLKFKTAQELQDKINAYFEECKLKEIPLSITGLALALDTNRQTLINYQDKDGYENIVDRAKLMIENAYEIRLIENGRSGDIFALKNFGWTDKQEIDNNIKVGKNSIDELISSIDNIKNENQ
jgi:hypothetical protein